MRVFNCILLTCFVANGLLGQDLPLKPAELKRTEPVDFAKEIQPLLQRNCVACHQKQNAESGLNVETHEGLVKGGDSGPGIVPGNAAESLIFARVTGREEPLMPPEDNDSGAVPFTPEELGLLQLWIEQGAAGSDMSQSESIQWQPLPENVQPVYALAASPLGDWVAVGRGSQLVLYDLQSGEPLARLLDPSLESTLGTPAAHADIVQSVAVSPTEQMLATGGFRNVKIWRKAAVPVSVEETPLRFAIGNAATSADQQHAALVNALGEIEIWTIDKEPALVATLRGHESDVIGLAWSDQDNILFSADAGGKLIAWDAAGKQLAAHRSGRDLLGIAVSKDGGRIAAYDAQGKSQLWNFIRGGEGKTNSIEPRQGTKLDQLTGVSTIAASRSSEAIFVVAAENGDIHWIKADDGSLVRTVKHPGVTTLACSGDGTILLSAAADGSPRLWNLGDGKEIAVLPEDPARTRPMQLAQQEAKRQELVVAAENTKHEALDKLVKSEQEAQTKVEAELKAAVEKAAADQKAFDDLAAQGKELQTKLAQLETEKQQLAQQIADRKAADAAAEKEKAAAEQENAGAEQEKPADEQPADEQEAAAEQQESPTEAEEPESPEAAQPTLAELEAKLAEHDKQLAELKKQLETKKQEQEKAEATKNESAEKKAEAEAALERAKELVARANKNVASHEEVLAAAKRALARAQQRSATLTQLSEQKPTAVAATFAAANDKIAIAYDDKSLCIYDIASKRLVDAKEIDVVPTAICELPGQKAFALLSADEPAIFASHAVSWQLHRQIGGLQDSPISDRVTAIDFHPDGNAIAVGSGPPSRGGEVHIFSVESGRQLQSYEELHSDTVLSVRFSPDGKRLASASADNTINVIDLMTMEVTRTLEGHTHHVLSVAWKADGRQLASASADQTIKTWDPETGEQARTISGFGKEVTGLTYIGTGSQLVTAAADGNLRIYDANNGRVQRTINAAGDFLYTLSLTGDEERVVAGGHNGVVRIWTLADGKQLHELK